MIQEELVTERLILRKLTPDVFNFLYENLNDDEIQNYLGLFSQEELEKEKEKFKKGLSTYNRSFVNFKIFDKETRKHIGNCGFHTWSVDHFRAEIGYDITDTTFLRKGIMTEALNTILNYGFDKMELHRVEALIGLNNIASLTLLQNFGFKKEGHLREHYFINNKMEDSIIYSLLKSEQIKI